MRACGAVGTPLDSCLRAKASIQQLVYFAKVLVTIHCDEGPDRTSLMCQGRVDGTSVLALEKDSWQVDPSGKVYALRWSFDPGVVRKIFACYETPI
jgi:hypothetical protein